MEEKSHEHHEHHHEHHTHEKSDEKVSFTLSKVRIWQGVSAVLVILVVVLWRMDKENPGKLSPY